MKKILFLILATFMTTGASAQEERVYVSFVEEGKCCWIRCYILCPIWQCYNRKWK